MPHDQAYLQAEKKIERALRLGLRELNLSTEWYEKDPKITELPESIGKLKQLRLLDLSHNQLTTLPESLAQLVELESLSLGDNRFTSLPEHLGKLRKLRKFFIYDNPIQLLPGWISNFTQLDLLDAARVNSARYLVL